MSSKDQIGNQARERRFGRPIGKAPQVVGMTLDSGLVVIYTEDKSMRSFMKIDRAWVLAIVFLVSIVGLATFAVARSSSGGSFNLNSPAAFPVDI